jgi:hypothetical protein
MVLPWIGVAFAILALSTVFALGVGRVIAARDEQVPLGTRFAEASADIEQVPVYTDREEEE